MSQIGMPQQRLDEIELRLAGADYRPWGMSGAIRDESGRQLVVAASRKAMRKTLKNAEAVKPALDARSAEVNRMLSALKTVQSQLASGQITDAEAETRLATIQEIDLPRIGPVDGMLQPMALFKLCEKTTEDMAVFVAHAPGDVEDLLNEVKFLRARYREAEKERDEFKKEMLSLRVEAAAVKDKLASLRRYWREFLKEVGGGQP